MVLITIIDIDATYAIIFTLTLGLTFPYFTA